MYAWCVGKEGGRESFVLYLVLHPISTPDLFLFRQVKRLRPVGRPAPRCKPVHARRAHRAPVGEQAAGRPPSGQPHGLWNQFSTGGADRGQTALSHTHTHTHIFGRISRFSYWLPKISSVLVKRLTGAIVSEMTYVVLSDGTWDVNLNWITWLPKILCSDWWRGMAHIPPYTLQYSRASVLLHCWLGGRKSIQPVKSWVMTCWYGYLFGVKCTVLHVVQLMPLSPIISCFIKIQNGFSFLVPACPGCPGKEAANQQYVHNSTTACSTVVSETAVW